MGQVRDGNAALGERSALQELDFAHLAEDGRRHAARLGLRHEGEDARQVLLDVGLESGQRVRPAFVF